MESMILHPLFSIFIYISIEKSIHRCRHSAHFLNKLDCFCLHIEKRRKKRNYFAILLCLRWSNSEQSVWWTNEQENEKKIVYILCTVCGPSSFFHFFAICLSFIFVFSTLHSIHGCALSYSFSFNRWAFRSYSLHLW